MLLQLLPELWGSAERNENQFHDFLLRDIIEVALVRDVQDSVRVLYHQLSVFLRQLEQLHSSRIPAIQSVMMSMHDVTLSLIHI